MKKKVSIFLTSNLVIAFVLVSLCALTFSGGYVFSVFGQKNNKAIYLGDPTQNNVSLMINVYWGTEFIEPMLDVFDEYGFKTTFFVGGSWADDNLDLLNDIKNRGHEIGNHGYFHKDHKKLGEFENREEIAMCGNIVEQMIGVKMNLFAPPSGAFSETTLKVAASLGYRTIMWSKDTIDWRDKDTQLILKRATNKVTGGDLILMHPTQNTLEALPMMLEYYTKNQFRVVTVSENIGSLVV